MNIIWEFFKNIKKYMFLWNEIQVKCDLRNYKKFEHVLYLKHIREHIFNHTYVIFILIYYLYVLFICIIICYYIIYYIL